MSVPSFKEGFCNTCSQPVGKFRDDLSMREFTISGMCQACQDSVFDCDESLPCGCCAGCGCSCVEYGECNQ